jgi:hypothetical protein
MRASNVILSFQQTFQFDNRPHFNRASTSALRHENRRKLRKTRQKAGEKLLE